MNTIEYYKELFENLIEYNKGLGVLLELETEDISIEFYKIYSDSIQNVLIDFNNEETHHDVIKLFDLEFALEFEEEFLSKYAKDLSDLVISNLSNNYSVLYNGFINQIKGIIDHDGCSNKFLVNLLKGSLDDYKNHLRINFDNKACDRLSYNRDSIFLSLIKKDYYILIKYIDNIEFLESGNLNLNFNKEVTVRKSNKINLLIKSIVSELSSEALRELRYAFSFRSRIKDEISKMTPDVLRKALYEMSQVKEPEITYFL